MPARSFQATLFRHFPSDLIYHCHLPCFDFGRVGQLMPCAALTVMVPNLHCDMSTSEYMQIIHGTRQPSYGQSSKLNQNITGPLDRDAPDGTDDWLINVVAQDQTQIPGEPNQVGYALLHVLPQDVNDNVPQFDSCCLVGEVSENTGVGGCTGLCLEHCRVEFDFDCEILSSRSNLCEGVAPCCRSWQRSRTLPEKLQRPCHFHTIIPKYLIIAEFRVSV